MFVKETTTTYLRMYEKHRFHKMLFVKNLGRYLASKRYRVVSVYPEKKLTYDRDGVAEQPQAVGL